jgi:predicted phosphodiesterase
MRKKFKSKYTDVIKKYLEEYPELSENKTALAKIIIKKEKFDFDPDYFRRFIRDYIRNTKQDTPKVPGYTDEIEISSSDDIFDDPRYEIYNDTYHWKSKKNGPMSISIKDADLLFYSYSKHGLDMSSTSVRLKFDIPLKIWFSLKYALSLYKDSHIISPYTIEITPDDELRSLIQERMQAKERDKERIIVEEHDKAVIQEYNKTIREFKTRDLAIEEMLDSLVDSLTIPNLIINEISPANTHAPTHIVAAVADLHIGAEAKELLSTPDFNYKILRDRLDTVANEINAIAAKEVSVVMLGDIIETATGLNHINTWQSIQDGAYGETVFKMAVEALIEFFGKINNLREVIAISGNHDRITPSRNEDRFNSMSGMIFYTLGKIYQDSLTIKHHYLLQNFVRNGLSYIAVHGDKPVFKRKNLGTEGVLEFGDTSCFNIVLCGHLHSREIIADHSKYRWIRCPGIFTGNLYSEEMGFFAKPGFNIIYMNERTGEPVVIDYTL